MTNAPGAHGRCLCGAIRYAVRGELADVSDCHCERCRQFTGHYMAATSAELDDIDIQDPDSLLRWFFPVPEAGYGFCSGCGSSLFWQSTVNPDRRSICAGTLEHANGAEDNVGPSGSARPATTTTGPICPSWRPNEHADGPGG